MPGKAEIPALCPLFDPPVHSRRVALGSDKVSRREELTRSDSMAVHAREHMEEVEMDEDEIEEELEPLLVCLDMLRGASALLRQHKAGLAGLLPNRGWKARRALERLVADLTDVLSARGSTTAGTQQQQQEEAGGVMARAEEGGRGGGVKRVRGPQAPQARSGQQHHEQQQEQQQEERSASPSLPSCMRADPLGLAEVVEHVISFAEGREVLGRLSRVCRLWRRVSEGERLCLRVVEQHMPCALLGGENSMHARLGGSARRCLQVHNASLTSGRLMCGESVLARRELRLLVEAWCNGKLLAAVNGPVTHSHDITESELHLWMENYDEEHVPFSPASLGVDDVQSVFRNGMLEVRYRVMDVTTGVVASLWEGPVVCQDDPTEIDREAFEYTSAAVPITSVSYVGPPLEAKLEVYVEPHVADGEPAAGANHLLEPERTWRISGCICLRLGQPAISGQKFISTRLAEEAMAAKQQGRV